MNGLYSLSGVRADARLRVAEMINEAGGKDRTYLGLPHEEWSDFHVVKKHCPSIIRGVGIEKHAATARIASQNMPGWCLLMHNSVAKAVPVIGSYFESMKISAGWLDLMGQVGSLSYDETLRRLSVCFDNRFTTIPMAFTWYAGREGDLTKNRFSAYAKESWDNLNDTDRHVVRGAYLVNLVSNDKWSYEPLGIYPIRKGSPMKLMTGVFTRV